MRRRQKILIVTDDAVGESMAGPAIRAWNMAEVLSEHHDVRLASTLRADASSPHFTVCDGNEAMLPGLAEGRDIIITQGFTLKYRPWLANLGAKMVVDLYDPIHLEALEGEADHNFDEHSRRFEGTLDALRIQIEAGDFFLCATERQRDLWLGHLSALGRVNISTYRQDSTLRKLIDLAPFGVSETTPQHGPAIRRVIEGIGPDDIVLLWAGGVYNWFDPITLVQAVSELIEKFPHLKLVFMGTKHPSLDDLSTTVLRQAIDLTESRGLLNSHVFFREGWVPYAQRGAFLTDADIGVSTHFLHVETAFSFRTRMLDYLWAGLPMVTTEGDEFARLIDANNLGRVVAAQDPEDLAAALTSLLEDPEELGRARAAVRELAPNFYWQRTLAPLIKYCDDPYFAPDKGQALAGQGRLTRAAVHTDSLLITIREYVAVNGRRRFLKRAITLAGAQLLGRGRHRPRLALRR